LYINIHTHHPQHTPHTLELHSLYNGFSRAGQGFTGSIGLHPWHLEQHTQLFIELQQYAGLPGVVAIGECGLDKVCNTDWALQMTVFWQQITLANHLDKPLIIHCVRAYSELLSVFKEQPAQVPVIIHGFNKNGQVAQQLLDAGMHLSFGAAVMAVDAPIAAVVKAIPPHRFFLETDDSPVPIADIYQKVASIRETTVEALILQQQHNYNNVFTALQS
jgi:TatD DNase family protein